MCAVPWGCSVPCWGVQYHGGVQYRWDIMSTMGDILSTVGVFNTVGDSMSTVGVS